MQVIAAAPPALGDAEAVAIARRHYGIDATAAALVSERDRNFRLESADGQRWVLKIANHCEDPAVTDFQIKALQYIAARPPGKVAVPAVVATLDGGDRLRITHEGRSHTVRLVSYIAGEPMDPARLSTTLARRMGAGLAALGQSLQDFVHAGAQQTLLWDMQQAPALRELLPTVPQRDLRDLLARCLDDFETRALPRFASLRAQVIHNDFNPGNVLVDAGHPDRLAGVIDFGDMQHAPLVVDPGVAAAYLRNLDGDPLRFIDEFVAGYHGVTPLTGDEIELLYDLVNTRLATTVIMLAWRSAERDAADDYLGAATASEESAALFLRRMRELPRQAVARRLRQVCRSVEQG